MYVQHAPVPVQASLVSPDMFASNIIQLKDGGVALMNAKIIKRVSNALKLFVFIFLFNLSNIAIPLYSILIMPNPIKPNTNGKKVLSFEGKKDKILVLKNAYINTSKILIANRKDPKYIFVRGFLL
tara:strand:+ start:571 stop:948 length:378 start_codon:yes stop_codon:yes gene_type:complete